MHRQALSSSLVYVVAVIAGCGLFVQSATAQIGGDGGDGPGLHVQCKTTAHWDPSRVPRWGSPVGLALPSGFAGSNGVPQIRWTGGLNQITSESVAIASPRVEASVNGRRVNPSVFLGNGASYVARTDFSLPLNGINWSHTRKFSTQSSSGCATQTCGRNG